MYKTLMCKQQRHACLRCSCLKHACLDLLCKRALRLLLGADTWNTYCNTRLRVNIRFLYKNVANSFFLIRNIKYFVEDRRTPLFIKLVEQVSGIYPNSQRADTHRFGIYGSTIMERHNNLMLCDLICCGFIIIWCGLIIIYCGFIITCYEFMSICCGSIIICCRFIIYMLWIRVYYYMLWFHNYMCGIQIINKEQKVYVNYIWYVLIHHIHQATCSFNGGGGEKF